MKRFILKGEFYSVRPRIDPPFEAQPFTVEKQPGYMLSVGLSEFTLNSASFALHSAGLLQTIITDSMARAPKEHDGKTLPFCPDICPPLKTLCCHLRYLQTSLYT